jgi:hypothetical protein
MRKEFPYSMSIGIGLIYKGGVILVSDTKTEAESGSKRFDLNKISFFSCGKFKCGIVRAGATDLSAQAVDLINHRTTENMPENLFDLRTIVHKSVGDTARSFESAHPNLPHGAEEGRFSIILAINDPEPHLYISRSTSLWPREESRGKAFIGTGEVLAEYIIGGMDLEKKSFLEVAMAAMYAVEICKIRDSKCEGQTRLGFIGTKDGGFFDQSRTDKTAHDCAAFELENEQSWIKNLTKWIENKGHNLSEG